MNSRQLEYFLAVAKELNFTRAAESMYVSQTAITQQIKALEEQLGVELFERTKRKVVLTPAGLMFQNEAAAVLNRMDMAVTRTLEASTGVNGSLKIGFTLGMANTDLVDRIHTFNRKYPNVALRFKNMSPSTLTNCLKEGELDAALMPMFHEKYYSDLCYNTVFSCNMVLVLPRDHALAKNSSVTWWEIKDEKIILPATPDLQVGEDSLVMENFMQMGIQPNVVELIDDVETIVLMVAANMGVTILPDYLSVPSHFRARVQMIPLSSIKQPFRLIVAWRPENDNPSLHLFLPIIESDYQDNFIEGRGEL